MPTAISSPAPPPAGAIPAGASPPSTPVPGPGPVAAAPVIPVTGGGAGDLVTARPLPVTPGQALAARVVAVQNGMVELALAGGTVTAASDLSFEPGQTLRLLVGDSGDERVTLRLQPDIPATPANAAGPAGPGRGGPAAAMVAAGIPASAASALLAAMAEGGEPLPTGAAAAALAARAAVAGVTTPAGAAAFVRLAAAGLPTTPAAVAGIAQLIGGAPLGRTLATLIDGAAATTGSRAAMGGTTTQTTSGGGAAAAQVDANWRTTDGPRGASAQNPLSNGVPDGGSDRTSGIRPNGPSTAAGAGTAPVTAPGTSVANLAAALSDLTDALGADASSGRGELLRRAIAALGGGLEARLAAGDPPDTPPLRSLLHALAAHAGTDAALARSAAGIADGLAAQGLAGATIPPPGATAPDPSQPGAYLQVPLPGGGTAEVRVAPDGGDDGRGDGERPRRLAFLLHLSALGPVMIEATAGGGAVDATIRVDSDEVRRFLAPLASELAGGLRRAVPAASVSVERLGGPTPERLLAPPPTSGLDLSA